MPRPTQNPEKLPPFSLHTPSMPPLYLLLPYVWWQLDDFFIGQARTTGLSATFKLKQQESEEIYTNPKFVLIAFTWLILLFRSPNINVRTLLLLATSIQTLLVLCQTIVTNTECLLIVRSLLGIGGAVFPGVLLMGGESGGMAALFVAVSPAEIAIAGPLLSGVVSLLKGFSVLSWQLLFVFHGILGLIVVLILWFKSPRSMSVTNTSCMVQGHSGPKNLNRRQRLPEILRLKSLVLIAMSICCSLSIAPTPSYLSNHHNLSFVSMPYFFFSIISDLNSTHLIFNLLTMAPYLLCLIVLFVMATTFSHHLTSAHFLIPSLLLSTFGFVFLSLSAVFDWPLIFLYLAIFPSLLGTYIAQTLILSLALSMKHPDSLLTLLLSTSQLSTLFSPSGLKPWWRSEDEPAHARGLGACAALMGLSAILALVLRWRRGSNRENDGYKFVGGDEKEFGVLMELGSEESQNRIVSAGVGD
ncbi:hypothetical protein HYFRA_00007652 [Hymenoscyphus fraxineus]|uniref:MFS general substrate transporter n=1 Tax=Hymenoscyphus fraxineus TaxID=746836 RepID=A0A9N9KVU7_9HELO|nr:hypothetical protein HYFRA_00007652 [Hymenoscyphus fraxineus]